MFNLSKGHWHVAIALVMVCVSVVACTGRISTATPTHVSIPALTSTPTLTQVPTQTQAPTSITNITPIATPTPLPASVTVGINAPSNVSAGSDFVAMVDVTQVNNLYAYEFKVTYDPAIIQVTGAESGLSGVTPGLIGTTSIRVDGWIFQPPHTPSWTIRVIGHLADVAGATGLGYLVQVHFHVAGTVGQKSDIVLSALQLFNNVGDPITATIPVSPSVQVTASP